MPTKNRQENKMILRLARKNSSKWKITVRSLAKHIEMKRRKTYQNIWRGLEMKDTNKPKYNTEN